MVLGLFIVVWGGTMVMVLFGITFVMVGFFLSMVQMIRVCWLVVVDVFKVPRVDTSTYFVFVVYDGFSIMVSEGDALVR